jgi:UDP-N-acetylmuramyl pentapeptide synthase
MSSTVTPSRQEKKHIFFCYGEKDESDLKVAALKTYFIERRLRVYHPRENEDINTKIAVGIENAAVVLVFSSQSLQMSKSASKILNYADQTKTPLLNIKIYGDFQPTNWLGAILAAAKSCSTDYNEVMKSLISMGIDANNLVLERDEKNRPQEMEKHLFHGGTKSGDVTAIYHQYGQQFPMEFEVFNEFF